MFTSTKQIEFIFSSFSSCYIFDYDVNLTSCWSLKEWVISLQKQKTRKKHKKYQHGDESLSCRAFFIPSCRCRLCMNDDFKRAALKKKKPALPKRKTPSSSCRGNTSIAHFQPRTWTITQQHTHTHTYKSMEANIIKEQ